jgi:hypothetical protein
MPGLMISLGKAGAEDDDAPVDTGDARREAVRDMMAALKADDAAAFAQALDDFFTLGPMSEAEK